ncbi:MAG: type II toxin-antitoxin system HigB family toxin [Spirochaetaceae bacterium]|nr:MAG: type II toxin-antitoxin system HigB family toxin [Spirochaetaceae bacterium]
MTVVGRDKLVRFMERHAKARPALNTWLAEARDASWRRPVDIKTRYPSADILPDDRVIFNIKGNHYRLVVRIRYRNGILYIEWVGTHAEYSKRSFGG